jgi:DNA polymerase III epsilon subunit family exonuclease
MRVALDLETTGLNIEQDAILEVAAIKFQGHRVVDTFETFIAPGRPIPYRVQRLTGIKPQLLAGAPPFPAISRKLQTFLGDAPIVGHSIPFDVAFLRRWGLARTNPLIDTFELATVLLPSLKSYNLGQVAEALGISVPKDRHRAMVDTVLAMQVFLALHERLQAVDLTLLKDLANLDAPRSWPLLHFFRQELRERQERDGVRGTLARGSLGDRFAAQLGMDPRVLSFAIAKEQDAEPAAQSDSPPTASSQAFLENMRSLGVVSEQDETAIPHAYQTARSAVREALEQRKPLLLEVATGGGDYTPALLPALEWVAETAHDTATPPRRLVIACPNQQYARRLIETTLPRLQALLKSQLLVAYLAEHSGYLCVHRWFGAALRRTSGELTPEQARGLAKVGLWAQQTLTGERSELTLLPQEMAAWQRIASGVERIPSADSRQGMIYRRCTYRQKGYCFVSRAEERVNAANVVVTTHAGLFDDLSRPSSLLAAIPQRLILEADLLEEEHGRLSSAELDQAQIIGLLNTIGVDLADGRYQGLLALAAPSLRDNGPGGLSTTPTVARTELDARMLSWFQTLNHARSAVEKLFNGFTLLMEEFAQDGLSSGAGRDRGKTKTSSRGGYGGRNQDGHDQPLRLGSQVRNLSAWREVENAWQQVSQRLQAVADLAQDAEKRILTIERNRHRLDIGSGEDSSVAAELAAAAQQLLERKKIGQRALSLTNDEHVYWLRVPLSTTNPQGVAQSQAERAAQPADTSPVLHTQLVQLSVIMQRLLFVENTSTILVGNALSSDHSFAFYRGRFGLENGNARALSVVDEHHKQTLLYLPNDVPEPNAPQYQRHLDDALMQLATTLDGQLVALFTSHAALRSTYAAIKPALEARGVLVLGQGIDGSPRQLWQVFQEQERVVLLGAGSMWEGIEDIVVSPTCLVITRLPMPVLNDPPMAARAEQYSDQLHNLAVPMASLRIKRALNRLLWNSEKRNAIVLFDRRVLSKEYGSLVLNSLPRCSQRQSAVSHMPETILDWLTGTETWE